MAISEAPGTQTVGTTEFYLASNSTTKVDQTSDCILQGWLDLSAMVAGDQFQITAYEKVNAGTQAVVYQSAPQGAQPGLFVLPSLILLDGWEVSVKKLAGTDRSIKWLSLIHISE